MSFRRNFNRRESYLGLSKQVLDWKKRIAFAGGTVSSNSLRNIEYLYKQLLSSGFYNKIHNLNPMVPDNIVAASVPLIKKQGNNFWINEGFTNEDVNINGIKGASGKYFKTGIYLNRFFNLNNGGITEYCLETSLETLRDFGAYDSSEGNWKVCSLITSAEDGYLYGEMWSWESGERFILLNSGDGYYSMDRTDFDACNLYKASDATPHGSLGVVGVSTLNVPTIEFYVFGSNTDGAQEYSSTKRISFFAIHDGLTESESLRFYDIIQEFRERIGGGFVPRYVA